MNLSEENTSKPNKRHNFETEKIKQNEKWYFFMSIFSNLLSHTQTHTHTNERFDRVISFSRKLEKERYVDESDETQLNRKARFSTVLNNSEIDRNIRRRSKTQLVNKPNHIGK